jgi:hypothetical protein
MNEYLLIGISSFFGALIMHAWNKWHEKIEREEIEDEEYDDDDEENSPYCTRAELEIVRTELYDLIQRRLQPISKKFKQEETKDLNNSEFQKSGIVRY